MKIYQHIAVALSICMLVSGCASMPGLATLDQVNVKAAFKGVKNTFGFQNASMRARPACPENPYGVCPNYRNGLITDDARFMPIAQDDFLAAPAKLEKCGFTDPAIMSDYVLSACSMQKIIIKYGGLIPLKSAEVAKERADSLCEWRTRAEKPCAGAL